MQQNNWTNKYSISEIVPETGPFFVLKSQYLAIVIVVRSVQSQSEYFLVFWDTVCILAQSAECHLLMELCLGN